MFRFHNLFKAACGELKVQHIHGIPYLPVFYNNLSKIKSTKVINPVTKLPTTKSRNKIKNTDVKRMPSYDALGASAKPNENCRTCTDFKFWSKQQRQIFNKPGQKDESTERSTPARTDCPLDKSELGRSTWGLLHTIGAFYPDKPTESQKKDVKTFFEVLSRIYPCEFCAQDFQQDIAKNPVQVDSQVALTKWLCQFHNRVNVKIGKPEFDCKNYNQRWRDGWLDGSCD